MKGEGGNEAEKRRREREWEKKSPVFLHTLMYWPEQAFLLNDFGRPLKNILKCCVLHEASCSPSSLCSSRATTAMRKDRIVGVLHNLLKKIQILKKNTVLHTVSTLLTGTGCGSSFFLKSEHLYFTAIVSWLFQSLGMFLLMPKDSCKDETQSPCYSCFHCPFITQQGIRLYTTHVENISQSRLLRAQPGRIASACPGDPGHLQRGEVSKGQGWLGLGGQVSGHNMENNLLPLIPVS